MNLGRGAKPPFQTSPQGMQCEPQDVAGLGPPPSEASDLKDRAAGRRGAGAPAVRDEHGKGGARTELGQTRDVSFRSTEAKIAWGAARDQGQKADAHPGLPLD